LTTSRNFRIFIVRKLNKKQKTQKKMKKSLVVFAILSTMILASCGGKAVETVATDSTVAVDSVVVDSTAVVADTVAVEVGGGAEGVEVEAAQGEAQPNPKKRPTLCKVIST
jgi:membrane protein involved in colicin uptake